MLSQEKFYKIWIKSHTEQPDYELTIQAPDKARAMELFKAIPALREYSVGELEGFVSEMEA